MGEERDDPGGPYGAIRRHMWLRGDFRALSFQARAVYAYARTCPAGGLVAIFPLRPEDIRDELGLGVRRADRAVAELEAAGLLVRLRHWVWLRDAFSETPGIGLGNPKHRTAVFKAIATVPDELAYAFRSYYGLNAEDHKESGTQGDTRAIHVDVDVAGDTAGSRATAGKRKRDANGDKRIHEEEESDGAALDQRFALLRRQAEEITAARKVKK